jgi:hypothetical protein
MELQLVDGEDIFLFLAKAQKIDTLCKRCRIVIPANGLIKKVIYQLHRSTVPQHQSIISPVMIAYTAHVRKLTESVNYYGETVATLTIALQDANVPIHARIDESLEQAPTASSIFDEPAAPTITDLYDREEEDDDGFHRLARISSPTPAASQKPYLFTTDIVNQLHALRNVIDCKKKQRGFHKATTGDSKAPAAAKLVCRFCAGPHDTETCMQRGEAFWPEEKIKKKERFNLLNGDKPKSTAATGKQQVPLKATFVDKPKSALKTEGTKTPEVRSMTDMTVDDLEEQLAEMATALESDIENSVDILDDLASHVIQAPSVFNIRSAEDGATDFHPLDSSSESGYEIDEEQVNC